MSASVSEPTNAAASKAFDGKVEFVQAHEAETSDVEANKRAAEVFETYALQRGAHFGLPRERSSATFLFGSAAAAVLDAAAAPGVCAVVLASHGRGGFRAAVFGSVADRIIRGASIPVLVVPGVGGPTTEIGEVLVTLDGSRVAEGALESARKIARALGARLSLLEAYSLFTPMATGYAYYPPEIPQELTDAAREYIKATAQAGERGLVVQGDAATGIVAAANDLDADLVVMSSHGKGFSKRFIIGSTTERVLHELHRPLLIMPPESG